MNALDIGMQIRSHEEVFWVLVTFLMFVAYIRAAGFRALIGIAVAVRMFLPIVYAILQYLTWSAEGKGLTQLLLPPHQPISYFLGYVWTTFGIKQVLSLCLGLAVYWICLWIQKYRETMLRQEEVYIATLGALIVGWPAGLLFLPCVVIGTTLQLLAKELLQRSYKATDTAQWTPWLLIVTIALLVWGNELISRLGLSVLQIGR